MGLAAEGPEILLGSLVSSRVLAWARDPAPFGGHPDCTDCLPVAAGGHG